MANITVYEFGPGLITPNMTVNPLDWPPFPADVVTTVASTQTVTLSDKTEFVVVCADADCRIGFNAAAVASGMPVLSSVNNIFRLRNGKSRNLQFA